MRAEFTSQLNPLLKLDGSVICLPAMLSDADIIFRLSVCLWVCPYKNVKYHLSDNDITWCDNVLLRKWSSFGDSLSSTIR